MSTTRSGFLDRYEELQKAEGNRREEAFIAADANWADLRFAVLEEARLVLPEGLEQRIALEERERFSEEASKLARARFSEVFTLTEDENEADARIRVAVTNLDGVNVGLNAVTGLLAVPVDNGGVSVELEILEVRSGRRLYAISAYETGKISQVGGFFTRWGHALSGFRTIVDRAATVVEEGRCVEESTLLGERD